MVCISSYLQMIYVMHALYVNGHTIFAQDRNKSKPGAMVCANSAIFGMLYGRLL